MHQEQQTHRNSAVLITVVCTALAAMSIVGFALTFSATNSSEKRLLKERAAEVAGVITTSTASLQPSLSLLGESYAAHHDTEALNAAARTLLTTSGTRIGIAEATGNAIAVRATQGQMAAGSRLSAQETALLARALHARSLVSAVVKDTPDGTALLLALGRADGIVVFEESRLNPTRAIPPTKDSPYRELNVALYASPTASADTLVLTTSPTQSFSGADKRQVAVGADHWLLVTSAKGWLAGSLAALVAWIILGGGLGTALLVAIVLTVIARRRTYAFALVDERTSELRGTLSALDAARQAADTANNSKSAFLSRMSHELRTPMNAVLGFAQVLQLDELRPDQQEAVDQILRGGKHLLALINEVLDISRIESGELALSPEAVLVSDVVTEAVELIRPLAQQQGIQVDGEHRECWDNYVFADRQRLKQILLNLLSNAVKYNRVQGSVRIDCEHPSATRMRIRVTDTGPGLRPEQLDQLFVPFERLGAERSEIEGTGIGLALSKRLAEAMGGSLHVSSTAGEGSTFSVELPLVEGPVERYERTQRAATSPARTTDSTDDRTRALLYIEDNLANLKLVQRVVATRNDIEIIPAMQGRLGVDLASEHNPALILLDLHLPDIRGDEVLQQLRDNPATSSIPVVVVSADATPRQQQRLLSSGAAAYITKPFEVQELLGIIDELLNASPQSPATTQR